MYDTNNHNRQHTQGGIHITHRSQAPELKTQHTRAFLYYDYEDDLLTVSSPAAKLQSNP